MNDLCQCEMVAQSMLSSEAPLNYQNGKFHFCCPFTSFCLYVFGCAGSSLCPGSLCLRRVGAALRCGAQRSSGFFCWEAWALGPAGFSRCSSPAQSTGSVIVAHGLSCCGACGIFLDQGLNPCLLQADSLPLSHQRSPVHSLLKTLD